MDTFHWMKDSSELVEGPVLVNMHILYIYISTVNIYIIYIHIIYILM